MAVCLGKYLQALRKAFLYIGKYKNSLGYQVKEISLGASSCQNIVVRVVYTEKQPEIVILQ